MTQPPQPVFDDDDARRAWNEAASAWDVFVESGADYYRHEIHGPGLLAECEPVAGLDVLDLGCGQGYLSRELARRGARVTAVDLSEQQLASARAHKALRPRGIAYHLLSGSEVHRHLAPGSFQLVAACMSLQDMADPAAALRSAWHVLSPGGRMAFSIPHPATDTPYREWVIDKAGRQGPLKIDRYFDSGPAVCKWHRQRLVYHWDSPYWRHTLTEWSAMVAGAGFLIRRLIEPRPTPEQVARRPQIEDAARLPMFLVFDLVRAP